MMSPDAPPTPMTKVVRSAWPCQRLLGCVGLGEQRQEGPLGAGSGGRMVGTIQRAAGAPERCTSSLPRNADHQRPKEGPASRLSLTRAAAAASWLTSGRQ